MNLKVRFKNPIFIVQIFLSILVPILTYAGLTFQDLTSWAILGKVFVEALQNPYVLGLIAVSVWTALNDPTTEGLTDSKLAMTYDKPKPKSK